MKKRVITGAILVSLLIVVLVLRQLNMYVFDACILFLSVAATIEIAKCVYKEETNLKLTTLICSVVNAVLTFVTFLILLLTKNLVYLPEFLCLNLAITIIALIITSFAKYKKFCNFKNFIPLIYPNYLFLFFYLINHLNAFNFMLNPSAALFLLVMVFVVSMFTDTFAMLIGIMIKGPKLCPKLSPKKTISGAVGGLIFGTGIGILTYSIFNVIQPFTNIFATANVSFGFVLLFSFLASLLCQIGDLFESYFKRKLNLKDTGTILAGHGGIMDRLDGVSFVVVIMFVAGIVLFL